MIDKKLAGDAFTIAVAEIELSDTEDSLIPASADTHIRKVVEGLDAPSMTDGDPKALLEGMPRYLDTAPILSRTSHAAVHRFRKRWELGDTRGARAVLRQISSPLSLGALRELAAIIETVPGKSNALTREQKRKREHHIYMLYTILIHAGTESKRARFAVAEHEGVSESLVELAITRARKTLPEK